MPRHQHTSSRWGKRERPDGYAPGRPLPGHTLKLFDLQNDPDEFINLAKRPGHEERVRHYLGLLLEHVKGTSRHPELIPTSDDRLVVLDYCVQPHDRHSARDPKPERPKRKRRKAQAVTP